MGFRIGTNVQSIAAQRTLGLQRDKMNLSLDKLSSGSRITRAADDAAGLAISEKFIAEIRSNKQATRNAQDAVSVIQVAEGSLNEVGNILTRLRELSIQAASDTIGDTERKFVDKEVQSLKSEVDRIASNTQFNGTYLLNGQGPDLEFQIGTGPDPMKDRLHYETGQNNATVAHLGVDGVNTQSREAAQQNLDVIDKAISKVSENRATYGAMQNRLLSTINNLNIRDENMSAANSRIRDVDFASETAELTKRNILTQAGVATLAQANSNTKLALNLL